MPRQVTPYVPYATPVRTPSRAAFRIAAKAGRAVGKYMKSRSTQTSTQPSKTVVTKYHDVRVNRKRRRLSRRKKKWIGFVKKVDKAVHFSDQLHSLLEQTGTQQNVAIFSGSATAQTVYNPTDSGPNDLRLGCYGSSSSGLRRFLIEMKDKSAVSQSSGGFAQTMIANDFDSFKFYVQSSVLNLTIRNPNPERVVIADIYECVSRINMTDVPQLFAQDTWSAYSDTTASPTVPAPPTPIFWSRINPNMSGSTPYACPDFGKYWKILKKTKVVLQANEMSSYKMMGYRGPVDCGKDMELGFVPKGKCKDLIIVFNPNGNDDFVGSETVAVLEWTKSYTFKWTEGPSLQQSVCGRYSYS